MFKRKKNKAEEPAEAAKPEAAPTTPDPAVKTAGWDDSKLKIKSRSFPGPAGATEALRIAMTKESYAELVGHAKESVDREICGVLLGHVCEDEYGLFVSVEASIRGTAAKTGGTHVTFTQETWNEIHKQKDEHWPKLQIVGWYHSHPGFGVEFSDMDLFIQRNFFSGPAQIAFVSDPLGGNEAICANTDDGIKNIRRFWVDGRERRCYVPREDGGAASEKKDASSGEKSDADSNGGGHRESSGDIAELTRVVNQLEDRVRQLTDAAEKQRNSYYNFLTFLGMLITLSVLIALGYNLFQAYWRPYVPPEEIRDLAAVVPMEINGKLTLVGLKAVGWRVPPQLERALISKKDLAELLEKVRTLEEASTQPSATQNAAKDTAASPASQPTAH